MKTFIYILNTLFLFSINASGQTVTLKELIEKTNCPNTECFNSFMLKKGFSPDSTIHEPNGIKNSFCFKGDKINSHNSKEVMREPNYTCFSSTGERKAKIDFGTCIKSDYRSILAELDSLKFQPLKSSGEDNKQITVYFNSKQFPNLKVIVTVTNESSNKDDRWISYLFEVDKE
jgi:hypothetical protein